MRLEGKVAIVTGASRGLGEYTATKLAAEGASVVVAARTEQVQDPRLPGTIHETAHAIVEAGGKALAVRCNVVDPEDCSRLAQAAVAEFGHIDILVNNAGIQPPGTMGSIQLRHWELEFKVNVHGTFYCTRAVLPTMLAQQSGVGERGRDGARETGAGCRSPEFASPAPSPGPYRGDCRSWSQTSRQARTEWRSRLPARP